MPEQFQKHIPDTGINNWQSRTALILEEDKAKLKSLQESHVLVVGLGGVGAYAAENVCRAGIGKMTIVDGDIVHATNRNRQLLALSSTERKHKADVMEKRLLDINPELDIKSYSEFIKDQRMIDILDNGYDFVIDAIDTLAPKIYLIYHTLQRKIPLVSSMGAGGKFDPERVCITDISKTYHCRLAYYIRKQLRKLDVHKGFQAVFSPEPVSKSAVKIIKNETNKLSTVGTISYMPAIFGCYCASVVIREILRKS